MASAIPIAETRIETRIEEPPATTLPQLIEVLAGLTDDEDEIVATLLHMVEQRSVRLVAEVPEGF